MRIVLNRRVDYSLGTFLHLNFLFVLPQIAFLEEYALNRYSSLSPIVINNTEVIPREIPNKIEIIAFLTETHLLKTFPLAIKEQLWSLL